MSDVVLTATLKIPLPLPRPPRLGLRLLLHGAVLDQLLDALRLLVLLHPCLVLLLLSLLPIRVRVRLELHPPDAGGLQTRGTG
jgi:hypothetical protein